MSENQEKIKQAFEKVKVDVYNLGTELTYLRQDLIYLSKAISSVNQQLFELKNTLKNTKNIPQIPKKSPNRYISTHNQDFSTDPALSTDTSTHNYASQAPKYQNIDTSNGNKGVSTDRQTDTRQTNNTYENQQKWTFSPKSSYSEQLNKQITSRSINKSIDQANTILEDLDTLKKEIRLKFKQITEQEMLVFSTIYQLEEQAVPLIDYSLLAQKLNLSQSSIRDYVQRLTAKGIPIQKIKINNKKISLSISKNLKKIASLNTILELREI